MTKLTLIILSLFFIPVCALCQIENEDQMDFLDAEYFYLNEEFSEALPIYLKLSKKYPDNANINYRIGMCYIYIPVDKDNPKKKAIQYFEKSTQKISKKYIEGSNKETGAPSETYFYLGNALRFDHQFNKAIESYEKFKTYLDVNDLFYNDFVNREIQATRNAIELIQFPVEIQSENLLTMIKAPAIIQNCPVISNDESVLVFTSGENNQFSPDIALNMINLDYEMDNIYFALKKDTAWETPRNIMKELGVSGTKVAPVTISGDGTELYLVKDDNDNGNIYVSKYKNGEWSPITKLNKNINTKYWESHATIVPDGKTLYFTSDRPGGYGGLDIYKSVIEEATGDWGPPENLGTTINTIFDEETPFILEDGVTMYFSSQGHYSMGGFDVFHSKFLENGKWSTPLNLGYPINTVGNDLFYLPKANGEYAFFPLNNNERGFGINDIYRIQVVTPESATPEISLKGLITLQDRKNVLPQNTSVYLIDKAVFDTVQILKADVNTGNYGTDIKPGDFQILYKADGYLEHEENLFIPEIYTRKEIVIDVELIPIEVSSGEYFVIRSIFFDYGKADLRKESQIELEKLAQLMNDNSSLYVEIVGHTDAISSAEFNLKLSEKRARSAIDYLVNKGINVDRFVSKGLGKSQHIAINENPDGTDNPEGRQLNRRVEIKILKSDNNLVVVEDIYVPSNLKYRKDLRTYTILVESSKTPLPKDFFTSKDKLNILTDIQAINGEHEILYTFGNYKQKSDALKIFNQIIDEGFNNSEIIDNMQLDELKSKQLTADILNNTNSDTSAINKITQTNPNEFYTIQLKALSKPAGKEYFSNLKDVKENLCPDGYYRYTYLQISDYQQALKEREKVVELGYPDAFIVKSNKFAKVEDQKGEFTIQLQATKTPVLLNKFNTLEGVKEHIGNDGWFKYTYGKFSSIEEAKKELKKVEKKGFPDAFVVNVEKYSD